MRYAIIIPDGSADTPRPELDGKTPLEAARAPNLASAAKEGMMLRAKTVPGDLPPGSDVACLSVLGFNPEKSYTGRAPLEAANLGITLAEGQAVYRANTVTIVDGVMDDYAAGHITTPESHGVIEWLDERLGIEGVKLYGGTQYRHACVIDGAAGNVGSATPPHDISGQPIAEYLPKGGVADIMLKVMDRSRELLPDCPVNIARIKDGKKPVTQLWLWGGGVMPKLETYAGRYGISGGLISAVDLLKGIGRLSGLDIIEVEGATGFYDTNYAGKAEAALECLKSKPFVAVHMEAPDEAGHNGHCDEKVRAIENIDKFVIGPLMEESRRSGDLRILIMPDHPTPLEIRTHTNEPVPACLWGPGIPASGAEVFSEKAVADMEPVMAYTLLEKLINT